MVLDIYTDVLLGQMLDLETRIRCESIPEVVPGTAANAYLEVEIEADTLDQLDEVSVISIKLVQAIDHQENLDFLRRVFN